MCVHLSTCTCTPTGQESAAVAVAFDVASGVRQACCEADVAFLEAIVKFGTNFVQLVTLCVSGSDICVEDRHMPYAGRV